MMAGRCACRGEAHTRAFWLGSGDSPSVTSARPYAFTAKSTAETRVPRCVYRRGGVLLLPLSPELRLSLAKLRELCEYDDAEPPLWDEDDRDEYDRDVYERESVDLLVYERDVYVLRLLVGESRARARARSSSSFLCCASSAGRFFRCSRNSSVRPPSPMDV